MLTTHLIVLPRIVLCCRWRQKGIQRRCNHPGQWRCSCDHLRRWRCSCAQLRRWRCGSRRRVVGKERTARGEIHNGVENVGRVGRMAAVQPRGGGGGGRRRRGQRTVQRDPLLPRHGGLPPAKKIQMLRCRNRQRSRVKNCIWCSHKQGTLKIEGGSTPPLARKRKDDWRIYLHLIRGFSKR